MTPRTSALLQSCVLAVPVLLALAPQPAGAAALVTREIQLSSGALFGLVKDRPQRGSVTVRTLEGMEVGTLDAPGDYISAARDGKLRLEFNQPTFELTFVVLSSNEARSAYSLTVSRGSAGAKALKTFGQWEGAPDGKVSADGQEGRTLLVFKAN